MCLFDTDRIGKLSPALIGLPLLRSVESHFNYQHSKTKTFKLQAVVQNLRPMNGRRAVSALATTLGAPRQTIAMASKNDEWGDITITGASRRLDGTCCRPSILTRWNPAATTTSLIRERIEKRSLL